MRENLPPLKISSEQVRTLVIGALAKNPEGQLNDLRAQVARVAVEHGLVYDPKLDQPKQVAGVDVHRIGTNYALADQDVARVQNIIWDLIIEGVVRPGRNDGSDQGLPFFHVTEMGRERIKDGFKSPYDPDGYLRRLRDDVPSIDDIIITYLDESLRAFRIGCLLASTITLGCASEKALLLLIDGYASALPTGGRQEKFRKETEGKMVKRQFEELSKRVESHLKGLLPGDLKDDLDVALNAIFTMFRNMRNDAGHPTGKSISREQAYANLVVFPIYVRKVYDLMDWLRDNSPLA